MYEKKYLISQNQLIVIRIDSFIATGKDDELSRSTLAKAANQLVYVSGIYAAFAIGYISKNTVAISARSSKKINVQMIMEDLNGGGHFSMVPVRLKM